MGNTQHHRVAVGDEDIAHAVGARAGREQRKAAPEERMAGIGDLDFRRVVYRWVIDRGIKMCRSFDRINQAALLEKIHTSPHFARPIKAWLKAGVVDRDIFSPTEDGTPQGGVASPLFANIALHGLEDVVKHAGGPATHTVNGKKFTHRTYCIRYADDFVVLHNTWEGIQRCKEAIQEWLKGMGLELKEAKTRFAHTLEAKEECNGNVGFNFLGFTIRQYPVGKYKSKKRYKTIIQPSKHSIEGHYKGLATVIERMKAATPDEVIKMLNPKIVGWSNYFKTEVSTKAFQRLDHLLWQKLYRWAKRKHSNKSAHWVVHKYFTPMGKRKHARFAGETQTLKWHGETTVKHQAALRKGVSPYDGNWSYWGTRRGKYIGLDSVRGKLLKHQGGRCTHCRLYFTMEDKIELHHADGNPHNGKFLNLRLLHRICHDLVHGKGRSCPP